MKRLTDYTSYADAQSHFATERLWELFDGDRSVFNIAHECVDRHAGRGREAVIVCRADGVDDKISFDDLSHGSSQFAHYLERKGAEG
jgi:acetyl-CoA synthetase